MKYLWLFILQSVDIKMQWLFLNVTQTIAFFVLRTFSGGSTEKYCNTCCDGVSKFLKCVHVDNNWDRDGCTRRHFLDQIIERVLQRPYTGPSPSMTPDWWGGEREWVQGEGGGENETRVLLLLDFFSRLFHIRTAWEQLDVISHRYSAYFNCEGFQHIIEGLAWLQQPSRPSLIATAFSKSENPVLWSPLTLHTGQHVDKNFQRYSADISVHTHWHG